MTSSTKPILYGFSHSTFVRTVRMLLAEKKADYEQVPVNVLSGEPRQGEHLARHPFGKVPVVDHDGIRLFETSAIINYLNDALPGPSYVPLDIKERARMDMAICILDSYGYGAMIGQVAAFHLFPQLFGGVTEQQRIEGIATSKRVLEELMKLRANAKWLVSDSLTLADFYLAPICYQTALTSDAETVFKVPGFESWWNQMQSLESFKATNPED